MCFTVELSFGFGLGGVYTIVNLSLGDTCSDGSVRDRSVRRQEIENGIGGMQ